MSLFHFVILIFTSEDLKSTFQNPEITILIILHLQTFFTFRWKGTYTIYTEE